MASIRLNMQGAAASAASRTTTNARRQAEAASRFVDWMQGKQDPNAATAALSAASDSSKDVERIIAHADTTYPSLVGLDEGASYEGAKVILLNWVDGGITFTNFTAPWSVPASNVGGSGQAFSQYLGSVNGWTEAPIPAGGVYDDALGVYVDPGWLGGICVRPGLVFFQAVYTFATSGQAGVCQVKLLNPVGNDTMVIDSRFSDNEASQLIMVPGDPALDKADWPFIYIAFVPAGVAGALHVSVNVQRVA